MSSHVQLLVRADDAGSSWSANLGCLQAWERGIVRSVEVMMPCAWVSHAANLYNQRSDLDIGIHLTLTSEWDAIRWRPLTHAPTLSDEHGYFLPLLTKRENDDRPCLAERNWSIDELAQELEAQISLGKSMFHSASHISSHMARHFRDVDPRIGEIIADLCEKFALKDDAFGFGLPYIDGYPKFPRDAALRATTFMEQLSGLKPGRYIFIDHPAVRSPELEASGHPGYEDVAADRISCLEVLTNVSLRRHIDELGIELISYTDL